MVRHEKQEPERFNSDWNFISLNRSVTPPKRQNSGNLPRKPAIGFLPALTIERRKR
jgi:hypothetical protein